MQYLLAKVTPSPGKLRLEITADYGGNPLIETEDAARVAIGGILTAAFAGGNGMGEALDKSATFQFHKTSHVDPSCPMPLPAVPAGGPAHQFLTGIAEIPANSGEVTFAVPKGNPNDAILWVVDEAGQPVADQKFYLVSGEQTSKIAVPAASLTRRHLALLLIPAAMLALLLWKKHIRQESESAG